VEEEREEGRKILESDRAVEGGREMGEREGGRGRNEQGR